jgi:polysaccharide pyruvyl transferase WcaK-like protein
MRISVLGATFETENMGVSTLTAGTIKCILSQHPSAVISLLDYAKKPLVYTLRLDGRDVSVSLVNMRFSKRFFQPNNIALLLLLAVLLKLMPIRKVRRWVLARNECLRHITEATLIASIAGGDSFSDIYGIARLLYVGLPQVLVLFLGKPLLLLPQTVGPFRGHFSRMIARYILRHALRVYTRDYRSLNEVEALLGFRLDPDRYKFCYDVGFALDPIEPSHQEVVGLAVDKQRRSPLVGLNISGLLFMGGYTRNNAFGLRGDYRVLVTSLIDLLISKIGANVLIVPHVFGMQRDSESDSVVCEQVFATLEKKYEGRLGLVRGTYNQSEIKYLIGQCDFFVGSRMHACIAAISQLVPAVCIAYSDKFAGVMATVGVEGLVADARKMDQEAILGIVEKAYDERALLRRQLERKMPKVRETVLSLFAGLSAPIQGAETGGAEGDPGALGGAGARAESGAGVEAAGTIKSDPDQVESPSARADIRSTCDTQTNDGFREGN